MRRANSSKRNTVANIGLGILAVLLVLIYIATPPGRFRHADALDASRQESKKLDTSAARRGGGSSARDEEEPSENVFKSLPPVVLLNGTVAVLDALLSDKVVLIVNVASKCGFTELNYRELQLLQQDFESEGFTVMAAPCNEFGAQEPGTAAEITMFAKSKGATFPMLEKLEVNGPRVHPLYKALKRMTSIDLIEWNFGKFLVGRGGAVLRYYDHRFPFEVIRSHVKAIVKLQP